MNPYPNNYGFRPPPTGYNQQRFVPQQRPPAFPSAAPPSSPTTDNNEKLTTLFVGAIAAGVSDSWIQKLLETCGTLKHWKRTTDPSGNPKGFGFATYADPESVLSALRVLGGEKTDGVTLTVTDGTTKKLIVKADDTVRQYLESYTSNKATTNTEADDAEKYAAVITFVSQMAAGQQEPEATTANDALHKELNMFKERAAQKDAPKPFLKGPTEHLPDYHELMATDQEIEQRRLEKHERDIENAYRQREKRFEGRQHHKLRDYERDLQRHQEETERLEKEKEYWFQRLATWDDEVELQKAEVLYYSDRSRWRKMRESQRRREQQHDQEDRLREIEDMEQERLRLEQEEREKKESKFLNREEVDGKIALKPKKLNFSIPIKRNTLGGADDDDEEEAKKKRRVLVPLDYGDISQYEEELSTEERAKLVKQLITSIPSSQEDLWSYQVKWDELDQDLIDTKLHPFVTKKIVELLGMEEDDLVTFVLEFVKQRKGPSELVTELEGALDEDALVFVMKFWRALIFETERKFKRL